MKYVTTVGDQSYVIEVLDENHILVDGKPFEVDFQNVGNQPVYSLLLDGLSYEASVYQGDESWQVLVHGRLYEANVEDEREKRLRLSQGSQVADREEFHLKSPMPGMVISVPVAEGQEVQKGDVLVILESMKMQNELKSPKAGVVTRMRVRAGDGVEQRQTLLTVV